MLYCMSVNAVTKVSTVRVPKAGEMVASQLRRQIVLGELMKVISCLRRAC